MKLSTGMKFRLTLLMTALLTAFPAAAQFYTLGSEPASVRWEYIETPTYRLIYPDGLDSLACVYAAELERAALLVGGSTGFSPNQNFSRRMPVVLHAHTAYSNGMVGWTPRRIELMTMPDPDDPDPTPWETQLAIHESRHASQMQYSAAAPFRGWRYISGQLASGALAAIYCGPAFFEGDAVVAETALTAGGRGRTADFLEYFRVSFAYGDFRDYWRWRYGSQRHFTPDYYRIGYITAAGVRTLYDAPDFTARYFRRIADHGGVSFNNFGKTIRGLSGKGLDGAFTEISDSLAAFWSSDEARRAPFMPSRQLTDAGRRYTELNGLTLAGDRIIAVRSGMTIPDQLVSVGEGGDIDVLGNFSSSSTRLEYSAVTDRLYWTEYSPDPRWEMRSYSNLVSMDLSGRRRTLSRGQRYFHPAAADKEAVIAVSEYPVGGGSATVVLDALDGERIKVFRAPDGLQVLEAVWNGDELYTTALSEGGYGIWRLPDFKCVLGPQHVKIKQPWALDGKIMFTSDLSGVNELYAFDPTDGSLCQLSSTRFGAADFTISADAGTLYYTSLLPEGRVICGTPVDSLICRPTDSGSLPEYPFVGELAAGEALKLEDVAAGSCEISEPRPYSKLAHLIRVHSWLPLYVDYDAVSSLSLSSISSSAGLGATVFFQNDLGDAWGSAAYRAAYGTSGGWRHSGHLNFNWSGWYPVIEAKLHFNERAAMSYRELTDEKGNPSLRSTASALPLLTASLNVYVPLSFSRGGWNAGIIPQVSIAATNDHHYDSEGLPHYLSRATAALRGYLTEAVPESRIYPRWGFGAELGLNGRPEVLSLFCPNFYSYLYGYVPGVWQTHGLKLTAMYEKRFDTGSYCEAFAVTAPRGFDMGSSTALSAYPDKLKLTADYALPLLPLDWSGLCPVAYVKNFELTLHGDLSLAGDWAAPSSGSGRISTGSLYSIGADFSVRLGNLLWIPFDTRIGLSWNCKGGSLFDSLRSAGFENSRHSVNLILSVDL